jgi:hypothetical protein
LLAAKAASTFLLGGDMITFRRARLLTALVGLAVAGTFGLLAGPAQAAASTFHMHESFPAAGGVFECVGGDLTVTAGTVDQVIQGAVDAQGIMHITGTITVHGVTLQDADGNTYTVSGAGWFGGKSAGDEPIVFTDTEFFVIHSADGGVYAKVQAVEHLSPNGKVISFNFGSCEPPQD